MSEVLFHKINQFSTYKVDKSSATIINKKTVQEVNVDEFLEISHILDSYHFNYGIDHNLNFISLNKL